jgi:hypothetical protein
VAGAAATDVAALDTSAGDGEGWTRSPIEGEFLIRRGLSALASVSTACVLFVSGVANAAPPTVTSVDQTNRHLIVSWTLAPGTSTDFIEVSASPDSDAFGFTNPLYSTSDPAPTSPYTSSAQFFPDTTYYVHVASCCTVESQDEFSAGVPITIRADQWPPTPPSLTSVGQVTRHVTAGWNADAGLTMLGIEVATNSQTDEDGSFLSQYVVDDDLLSEQARSYQSSVQLAPGTYYLHVSALDLNCVGPPVGFCPVLFSSTASLVVPADSPPPPPLRRPAPPADKITSFSALRCASTQKAGSLVVQASMPENGTITVGGTLNVPNAAKVFKLKAVSVNAPAGKTVKITVKLPSRVLKAVKKALKRHKKVKASLTITAKDGAGNKKAEKRAVRLK